ncbi:MAG: ion transporter [Pseudomonadota bacterium]
MQDRLKRITDGALFQNAILVLILVNAAILGLETVPSIKSAYGDQLMHVDRAIIYAFVAELVMRFIADPKAYFRNGWNIFDFVIVMVSLIAATSGIAAIRAFRVLRVLRVVTVIPRMRVVVAALLDAIPGIASVGVVLVIILYVFAVIAANLYGGEHPTLFGDVFTAMYTLFTVMTLEGWREIADTVAATHPRSWVFFLSFVLIATFTMLNLFVAIVVRVVEEDSDALMTERTNAIRQDIGALREDIARLHQRLDRSLD